MRDRLSLSQFLLSFLLFTLVFIIPLSINHAAPSATENREVSYTRTEFIKKVAPTIQKVAKYYGIRPSVVIGQAVLESNYGRYLLATKYYNLFAVESKSGGSVITLPYQTYINGNWQTSEMKFVIYRSWDESIYSYFALLQSGQLGNSTVYDQMIANPDYKKLAQVLQDTNFGSDPKYASKLVSIIEENRLTDYDN